MNESIESVLHSCFNSPEEELSPLFAEAFEISRRRFSDILAVHAPGMVHYSTDFWEATEPYRFPAVSITGTSCALHCEHCDTRLLESMIPATTPEELWKTCLTINERGGLGVLVSGGSTARGDTPILHFIPTLKRVKEELGLDIVVHTGIVYPEVARALGDAGIDGAMLDIIGDDDTLREIYHLNLKSDVFDRALSLLEDSGVPTMPHIVVGLYYGRLRGEANAIRIIARHNPECVIIVAFKPLDLTPMVNVTPPSPMDIARVILATRLTIIDRPVILGCARPHGEHRRQTDRLAIEAGVNGIAYPTEEAVEYSQQLGLKISTSVKCCSLMNDVLPLIGRGGGMAY